MPRIERLTYGEDPSQYGVLHLPDGPARGTCVVIHGGFWKARYGVEYALPLAEDLAARGWVAFAPEYRRVGSGGGFPQTFDDLDAAFSSLVEAGVDTSGLVVFGHSAGGHLAAWAAARGRFARWRGDGSITAVFSQAGVLDLEAAHATSLGAEGGRGAVENFVGPPGPVFDLADPTRQLPLDVPIWCFHARDDEDVPFSQSETYVASARGAGASAELVEVPGGHFGVVDVASPAWAAQLDALASLGS